MIWPCSLNDVQSARTAEGPRQGANRALSHIWALYAGRNESRYTSIGKILGFIRIWIAAH